MQCKIQTFLICQIATFKVWFPQTSYYGAVKGTYHKMTPSDIFLYTYVSVSPHPYQRSFFLQEMEVNAKNHNWTV